MLGLATLADDGRGDAQRFLVMAGSPARRHLAVAIAAVAVVAAVLAALAGVRIASVSTDLRGAQEAIDRAALAMEDGRLADARSDLAGAQELLTSATNDLYAAELDLAGGLPVVRQNLSSLRVSVGLALRTVHAGGEILDEAAQLEGPDGRLDVSLVDGVIPLEAIRIAQSEATELLGALPGPDELPQSSLLVGPVREARERLLEESESRREQLRVLAHGLGLLEELAGGNGDRRYLIAVANTAEMRGSGGMVLNYGVLEGRAGAFELPAFGRVDELLLTVPVDSGLVPEDYLARWNGFEPLTRWRQANLAADFEVVAPVLEAMYTAATGEAVDGVIQIDPHGLSAILDGVGPVVVPELGEVRGDNVVALTLNEAYRRFPGVEERSDVLGEVAEAVFRRLVDGDVPSLRSLAGRLVEAVDGRHVLMHTTRVKGREEVRSFGAAGALPPLDAGDSLTMTVQNLSGTKLDYYLDTDLMISGERLGGAVGTVSATVTLTNSAPRDDLEPAYVFGPGPTEFDLPAGVARSLTTLYLPLGTSLSGTSGDILVEPPASGTEAGRPYVAFTVDVPASEARTVVLELQLAPISAAPYVLDVVPSPRVRPTTVRMDIATDAGPVRGEVVLDRRWRFRSDAEPRPVVAPAFR